MFNKKSSEDMALKLRQASDKQREVSEALAHLPWIAAMAFIAALAAMLAVLYMMGQVSAAARTVQTATPVTYRVVQDPLALTEYQDIVAELIPLHPDVRFEVGRAGTLSVALPSGEHHASWLFALSALQSRGADILWDVDEFCVGRCGGPAAYAIVRASRQQMRTQR